MIDLIRKLFPNTDPEANSAIDEGSRGGRARRGAPPAGTSHAGGRAAGG
jgi:hypothetical protein